MKAAVLVAHDAPLELADVECLPLAFGQVRVKVLSAGICGAQLQEIRGEKGGPLPHLLGHEGCGIVQEVGAGVTRVKAGDKVCMHWRKAAGIESPFPRYRRVTGEEFASGLVTTFAEETVCSENRLTPVPDDTEPEIATLLGCSLSTALATVEREARWGERVMVIGCGGLGLALLGALEMIEPVRLCACDIQEEKRDQAEQLGAHFFASSDFSVLDKQIAPERFDLILDTAGAPEAMENALPYLAPSGRYVMIGQPKPKTPVCIRNARHLFDGEGKTIKATQGGGFRPHEDIPRFLKLAESTMFYRLVTHTFTLERINEAIDIVRRGQGGRVLLNIAREERKPAADPLQEKWRPERRPIA